MQTRTVSRTRTDRKHLPWPWKIDLSKAPWQKESAKGPLKDLEKIAKVAKPIYDGFWHDRDQDIINRLDQGSQKAQGEEGSPASGQQGR